MKTSERGIRALQTREALRLTAYQDGAGVWTIGYGQTGPLITKGTTWTKEQATEAFEKSLRMREAAISTFVTVPLTQNQFDALVSLIYNIGVTNFKNSTLLHKLNASDVYVAYKQFAVWNKIRDPKTQKLVVSPGLTNRRTSEAEQFNTPDPT